MIIKSSAVQGWECARRVTKLIIVSRWVSCKHCDEGDGGMMLESTNVHLIVSKLSCLGINSSLEPVLWRYLSREGTIPYSYHMGEGTIQHGWSLEHLWYHEVCIYVKHVYTRTMICVYACTPAQCEPATYLVCKHMHALHRHTHNNIHSMYIHLFYTHIYIYFTNVNSMCIHT